MPHLLPILARGAVRDGKSSRDEVVLNVHDDEGGDGSHNLERRINVHYDKGRMFFKWAYFLDPVVPAVDELFFAHAPIL